MTLQNNFTTPEQSKRLLKLGVPADSADCHWQYRSDTIAENWGYRCYIGTSPAIKYNLFSFRHGDTIPCWSVGRLMGIYAICFDPDVIEFDIFADGTTFLKQMIDKFEIWIDAMDFSKFKE